VHSHRFSQKVRGRSLRDASLAAGSRAFRPRNAERSSICEVAFGRSGDYIDGVRVYKRPFFTAYTTSLWIRFLRFSLQSHKKLEEDLHKLGLTPPQFYVLATIGYAGGLPFGEIGAKMMVTVSNLTGIVDRLEEKKLVSRKRDENDRRVVHVVLTDKGAKLYTSTLPLFEKSVSEIFAALDSGQQKELSALLRKVNPEPAAK
jgi:MarR family 2-MHQ and catechol resistance regulon transcriptional repressor